MSAWKRLFPVHCASGRTLQGCLFREYGLSPPELAPPNEKGGNRQPERTSARHLDSTGQFDVLSFSFVPVSRIQPQLIGLKSLL